MPNALHFTLRFHYKNIKGWSFQNLEYWGLGKLHHSYEKKKLYLCTFLSIIETIKTKFLDQITLEWIWRYQIHINELLSTEQFMELKMVKLRKVVLAFQDFDNNLQTLDDKYAFTYKKLKNFVLWLLTLILWIFSRICWIF